MLLVERQNVQARAIAIVLGVASTTLPHKTCHGRLLVRVPSGSFHTDYWDEVQQRIRAAIPLI